MSSEDIAQAEKRSQHRSIVIDKVLYTWGGNQPGLPKVHDNSIKRKLTSRINTLHIPTGIWKMTSTTGSPPLGVSGYSCSVIDDQNISFFGGWCGHDDCYHNSLHALNTKGFNWRVLSHTTDDIPVMRRGFGGMITVEDHDGIKLLMIGGLGSPPTIPNQQFQYMKMSDGVVRTNEVNLFTPSTGKWSTPTMIGNVMPPNNGFTIENLSKSKAIIFGGLINEGFYTTNNIYIVEIINSTVHWQNIKSSQSIGQWPKGRHGHASSIINSSVLAVLGGLDQTNQVINEKCLWLYSIDRRSWTKIDVPDTVSGRYAHSLSSLMIGPHCVWLVVLGGRVNLEKKNVDGVDKFFADWVSSPNISMIIELMFSDGDWSLGFVLDEKLIHLLELIYKDRVKHNLSNDEISPEDDSLKELRHSLYKDLETSQQTIKSLQEALLDTKEEWNKQVKEKDSLIAKLTGKVPEHTLVNELEEKDKVISKLIRKLQNAEELREKKQDEESKPTNRTIDDITFELEQNKAIIANLSNELKSLKESNKLIDDDKSCTQLVHDNDCQFTLDDVSKLMVILQPVEDDWNQLGHHLDMEESTLRDIKQTGIPLEYLLQRWCSEGGTLMKLEKALICLGKTDLISGLRQLKPVMKMDVSVQFNYMTPSIDSLDYLSEVHKAAKKLFIAEGDGHPQLLNWEEYGLRIGIPKGSLMSSETTEIAVVALVGGQFKFPKRTQLVSAVYAISVSKPLVKPLRLDMQHCVNITRPSQINYLKFAIASVDTPSLPYQFEVVKGGKFTVNSFYGSIHRQTFSFFAIVADEADILPVPLPDDPDPTPSTTDDEEEEEDVPSGDDTNGQEEEGNGSTSSSNEEGNGCTNSDNESTQSNESHTHGASGSAMVNTSCENEEEVKTKPIQSSSQESNDERHHTSPGLVAELLYAGIIFDEGKQHKDFVTFATTKHLNALLMYIKENHPKAETGQCIQFSFQPSANYIELIFDDSHQDDPCTGWIIRPQLKPCRLLKIHIDNFGNKEPPVPVSCLISVYSIDRPDTVPVLNYGIPLEGVDPPVTIFIHRALRTTNTGTPLEATPSSSSGAQPTPSTNKEVDVNQLRQVIDGVLVSRHANLTRLPEESLQDLADQLFASKLISNAVKKNPTMDKCISEFNASLHWLRNQSAIKIHCIKFLKSFKSVGGSYSTAADILCEDLIEAVNNEFNCNIDLS